MSPSSRPPRSRRRAPPFPPRAMGALAGIVAAPLALAACGRGQPSPGSPQSSPRPPSARASAAPDSSARAAAGVALVSAGPIATGKVALVPPAPVPTSAVATIKTDAAWATCLHSNKATKDLSADVAAMAHRCEKQTKMTGMGKALTGEQADRDPPQSFPFEARAGHCYRVYGRAAASIKHFDLALEDSSGAVVGEDTRGGPSPVVLDDGAVCFTKDDTARVVVSVGMGSGSYALQIGGD